MTQAKHDYSSSSNSQLVTSSASACIARKFCN